MNINQLHILYQINKHFLKKCNNTLLSKNLLLRVPSNSWSVRDKSLVLTVTP